MYVNAEDTGASDDTLQEIKEFWWRFGYGRRYPKQPVVVR